MNRHPHGAAATPAGRPMLGPDHAEVAASLATTDMRELGARLRLRRKELGLTQTAVCSGIVSTAYLSRIESGERRPDLKVLQPLAERLGSSPQELLLGLTAQSWSALEVEHDWAQLSLRTGNADQTMATTTRLLAELPPASALFRKTLLTHALALEATGDYDQAALHLEDFVDGEAHSVTSLEALLALSRVYREGGELGRAIEVGERAQTRLAELQMEGTPEAVKLALTVAAAHSDNGDVGYALRLCQKALRAAEQLDDATARAVCYWSASSFESRRGNHREAVALARQALATLDHAESRRHAVNLRTQLGILLLRIDPPLVEEALGHLQTAEHGLETTDSSPADLADNRLAQARAHFLRGDRPRARVEAERVLESSAQGVPLMTAEAFTLLGQIEFHDGDHVVARSHYQQAIMALSSLGADRSAAQLWFELGGLWLSIGASDEALQAFRRAGASTGLHSTSVNPAVVAVAPR